MESQGKTSFHMEEILQSIKFDDYNISQEEITMIKNCYQESRSTESRVSDIVYIFSNVLVSISNVESRKNIIKIGLTASTICLKEVLSAIGNILGSCDFENSSSQIESDLSENLGLCLRLLQSFIGLLTNIISNSPVSLLDVEDLPKCVGLVLLDIFRHCKNSETLYSSYFHHIGSDITDVFKKCHELQTRYFVALTEHIHFDLSQEDNMSKMLEVLDIIVDIGEVVISLDVKTMAEEWKGYSKLCEQHADWLRDKYVHHKATEVLGREIRNNLNSLVTSEMNDPKNFTRCLKISSFIIKILIKISEVYSGYLSSDLGHLIILFSSIYQYSSPQLVHLGVNISIIEGIRSHITVGAEPFLLNLLTDQHFRQSYLQQIRLLVRDKSLSLGCLVFNITVMKLLLTVSEDVRECWTNQAEEDNIINCVFDMIPSCHVEFSKGLQFSNEGKENISLYDYTLIHTAALAISCKGLDAIEKRMLVAILQSEIWGALLAIDLWTVIARFASAEFRFDQMVYLVKSFDQLCKSEMTKDMPQAAYFSHLLRRLFVLLPNKMKAQILLQFPALLYPNVWNSIRLQNLPEENISVIENVVSSSRNSLADFFAERKCSEVDFKIMIDHLNLLSTISDENVAIQHSYESEWTKLIIEAWQKVILNAELEKILNSSESSVPGCQWLNIYLITLCKITSQMQHSFSNKQWTEILQIIEALLTKSQSCIKIAVLDLLNTLVHYEIAKDNYKEKVISLIATLFRDLLEDKESLINTLSLEVITHFARITSYETIISLTVNGRKMIKQKVTNFFLKQINQNDEISVDDYYKINPPINFMHKCEKIVLMCSPDVDFNLGIDDILNMSDEIELPNKKAKIDASNDVEIVSLIERLKKDSELLTQICAEKPLHNEHKSILFSIKEAIKSLVDN